MADTKNMDVDVRVYPIKEPKNNIAAFASVTIGGIFAVNNIRVVNSEKGAFVAMPQVKDAKGEYRDICFPVTADFRKQLHEAILGEYANVKDAPAKDSVVGQIHEAAKEAKAAPAKGKEKAAPKKSEPEL